ncbi:MULTISPECIES: hypothetical protein [unclassified Streptomyces]|uniref:hypothetical protein n=1 Tax=unclassified Streptomyces TaxID=2593676 RepID=UPI001906E5BF|nr:hypothetical protein [Streptomyces sp. HSG2]
MRAISVASVALLGACALSACVPASAAIDDVTPFEFSVLPSTVPPGGEVVLRVDRNDGKCKGRVTVSSPVFDTVTIPRRESWAKTTVDRDAKPGAVYRVTFTCDDRTGTTDLTIEGRHEPTHKPWPGDGGHDQRSDYPDKGVHAGEGGSLGGFDLGEIGLGAALVAGSVGAAYHLARRRGGANGG